MIFAVQVATKPEIGIIRMLSYINSHACDQESVGPQLAGDGRVRVRVRVLVAFPMCRFRIFQPPRNDK